MELLETTVGKDLGKWLVHMVGGERYLHRQAHLVLCHGDEEQVVEPRTAVKLTLCLMWQLWEDECLGELAPAIGTEVKIDNAVASLDTGKRMPILLYHDWLNELVGNSALIRGGNCGDWMCGLLALTTCHGVVDTRDAFPPIVTVHGVVAPRDGSDSGRVGSA